MTNKLRTSATTDALASGHVPAGQSEPDNVMVCETVRQALLVARDDARGRWLAACGVRTPPGTSFRFDGFGPTGKFDGETITDESALVAWKVAIDVARYEYDDALDRLREFNREEAEKRLAEERAAHAAMERDWREQEKRAAAAEEKRLAEQGRRDQERREMEIDQDKRAFEAQKQHRDSQYAMIAFTFLVMVGTLIQAFK
jgi:hypothetical protein